MASKRKSYTLRQNVDILRGMDSTSLSTNKYAASQGITSSILWKWKTARPSIQELCADPGSSVRNIRRLPDAGAKTNTELDIRLFEWFNARRNQNLRVKDKYLKRMAIQLTKQIPSLEDFRASY